MVYQPNPSQPEPHGPRIDSITQHVAYGRLPTSVRAPVAYTGNPDIRFQFGPIFVILKDKEAARSLVDGLDNLREVVDKVYPDLDAELTRQRHERAKGLRLDERVADINYLNGGPPADSA
jgi:hypothetical protein